MSVAQIERARRVLPIVAVQNEYSLAQRKHDGVVDYCASAGIVFVPFFPLRGADTPRVQTIAARRGDTPTQIALAWLLRRSPVMLTIPGTRSTAPLQENLAALSIALTADEFSALSGAPGSLDPGAAEPSEQPRSAAVDRPRARVHTLVSTIAGVHPCVVP